MFKNQKGSSSIEMAIILVPITLLFATIILLFNKNTLYNEGTYAILEGLSSAVYEDDLNAAEIMVDTVMTDILSHDVDSDGNPKIIVNSIIYTVYDETGNDVTSGGDWCKGYTFEIDAQFSRPSPFPVISKLRDDVTHAYQTKITNSAILFKIVRGRIQVDGTTSTCP